MRLKLSVSTLITTAAVALCGYAFGFLLGDTQKNLDKAQSGERPEESVLGNIFSATGGARRARSADTATYYTAKRVLLLMGTRFEIGATAKSELAAQRAVDTAIAEVRRIESVISSWDANSETSHVNRSAGGGLVEVSPELYGLLDRSLRISELTDYAFDIAAGGLMRLYRFGGQDTTLPTAAQRRGALAGTGRGQIVLEPQSPFVELRDRRTRIGFGGIGKGYAANRALARMRALEGVAGGVVNAAGDLAVFGRSSPTSSTWTIGIADPRDPARWLGSVSLERGAIVTSGDYEKYFTAGGVRYAHIVDPATALPTTGVRSATVVSADAEIADALATSLFVLGPTDGIALLDRLKGTEGLVVDSAGVVHTSRQLKLQPYIAE